MESSDNNGETLIWYNINDARNLNVITNENKHIRSFVPKVAVQKNVEIANEIVPESTVQDILGLKYTEMNVFEIITHQVQVISYLAAKFRSTDAVEITWSFYRTYLQWILETSEFITQKFNIPVDDVKQSNVVTRSSYKFCDLKEACNDTYKNPLGTSRGEKKSQRCMGDHYVHNKIVRDLRSLISIIDNESSEQGPMTHSLRLGLTTTDFVIRHMHQELGIFNTYLKSTKGFNIDDYYICHRSKSSGPRTNNFANANTNHRTSDHRTSDHRTGDNRTNDHRGNDQRRNNSRNNFSKNAKSEPVHAKNVFSALDEDESGSDSEDHTPKDNRTIDSADNNDVNNNNVATSKEEKVPTVAKPKATFEYLCELTDSDEEKPTHSAPVIVKTVQSQKRTSGKNKKGKKKK